MAKSSADIYNTPAKPVPTYKLTVVNATTEQSSLAQHMDVDRLHATLRSAEAGNMAPLMALYRDIVSSDSHLQAELHKRKLAVLGDSMSYRAFDGKIAADNEAAASIKWHFGNVKGWIPFCSHLLDSTLWPVAIAEKIFRPSQAVGAKYEIAELVPVPHQLIDYRDGTLKIFDVDQELGTIQVTSHAPDPERYIIHRGHLLSFSDTFGGPMRSLVFWWLLSAMDRGWWARYLDRYGSPFLVGKYDGGDDQSRSVLETAFAYSVRIGGLVVTKETEVEIKETAAAGTGEAYEKFLTICQREKSKLILGQTLSAEAQATGMNSGTSASQENVRQDIRVFDGMMLAATLRDQLGEQLLRINNIPGRCPVITFGSESPAQLKSIADLLSSLNGAGLEVADEAISILSERMGFLLQRNTKPTSPMQSSLLPLSATALMGLEEALASIASRSSAGLSQAFRGHLAPIQRMIQESKSKADLEAKIRAHYAEWKPGRINPILEQALTAFAANGTIIDQ